MTPQELRRSVIQFAIQGKLNVGLPEDGTGEDLVRNIIAQKTELIKTKIIKKEKNHILLFMEILRPFGKLLD